MNKQKQTVLIVDDEPLNIQLLGQWLNQECRLVTATDAENALTICAQQQPDLVLLDIVMPGIDGYEVCRRMKNNPDTVNIPLIFITGKNSVADEAKGLELGAVDYITKPFNKAIVMARVRNQLLLKKKTDMLEQLISVDGLTEIPNRRYFDQTFSQEWRRAQRNKQPIAVFMCDIDEFKKFNDHYGHAIGDECLRKVAQVLSDCSQRAGEFVARYGGEEFVAVLPSCTSQHAESLATRMLNAIEELKIPHEKASVSEFVTMSIGIAVQSPGEEDQQCNLMIAADEQLYKAKNAGRNQFKAIELNEL